MTEAHIKLAARLYDARTALKSLWGDEYHAKIAVPMQELQKSANRQGLQIIPAAMNAAKHFTDRYEGGTALIILAAAVEILEPSE